MELEDITSTSYPTALKRAEDRQRNAIYSGRGLFAETYPAVALAAATCFTAMSGHASAAGTARVTKEERHISSEFTPDHGTMHFGVWTMEPAEYWEHPEAADRMGNDWLLIDTSPVWLEEAEARISYFEGKGDGWKGEGSQAAPREALKDARAFLSKLSAEGCQAEPMIGMEEDGELMFFWQTDAEVLSISVIGDGKLAGYGRHAGQEIFIEEEPLSAPLKAELLGILKSIGSRPDLVA